MNFARTHLLLLISLFLFSIVTSPVPVRGASNGKTCRFVDIKAWDAMAKSVVGKELIAFASWCSSCKKKLLSTKSAPENFLMISVFEDPEQSARAMERLGLDSPCIYGDGLAKNLGITEIPWSKKI